MGRPYTTRMYVILASPKLELVYKHPSRYYSLLLHTQGRLGTFQRLKLVQGMSFGAGPGLSKTKAIPDYVPSAPLASKDYVSSYT